MGLGGGEFGLLEKGVVVEGEGGRHGGVLGRGRGRGFGFGRRGVGRVVFWTFSRFGEEDELAEFGLLEFCAFAKGSS